MTLTISFQISLWALLVKCLLINTHGSQNRDVFFFCAYRLAFWCCSCELEKEGNKMQLFPSENPLINLRKILFPSFSNSRASRFLKRLHLWKAYCSLGNRKRVVCKKEEFCYVLLTESVSEFVKSCIKNSGPDDCITAWCCCWTFSIAKKTWPSNRVLLWIHMSKTQVPLTFRPHTLLRIKTSELGKCLFQYYD